jgi:tetratricopeptide (TPR) repeat protein
MTPLPGLARALTIAAVVAISAACAPPPPRVAAPLSVDRQTAISRDQAWQALAAARAAIGDGDYSSAKATAASVIPDAERWGWLDAASDARFLLGEIADREREPRVASDAYARAYDASRRLGDRARGTRDLNALTNALLDAGALPKASEAATEALRLAEQEQNLAAQATAQNNLGEAHRLAGRLTEAREAYEQALGHARRSRDRVVVASVLLNLGALEQRAGRLAQARSRFTEARDLARSLGDSRAGDYAQRNLELLDAEISRGGQR